MSKLIEKYIYAVTKRCPEEKRDEIKKELESNIYDMLSDKPTDLEIENVLHQLGNPIYVASKYQDEEKYVVSPVFYQDYLMVLRWTLVGALCLAVMVSAIQALTFESAYLDVSETIKMIFAQSMENLLSFMLFGFAIVTLIFWSINTNKAKEKVNDWLNNWKTSDLMDVPSPSTKTKKYQGRTAIFFEAFFSLLFQSFFVIGFIVYQDLIGVYIQDTMVSPIFGEGFINTISWFLIIGLILKFFYYAFYLKAGRKDISVLSFYTIDMVFSAIVGIVFVNHPNLLSPLFIQELSSIFTTTPDVISYWIGIIINAATALVIFITTIDLAVQWYKHGFRKEKANA